MLKLVSSVRIRFVGVREETEVEERLDELDILDDARWDASQII